MTDHRKKDAKGLFIVVDGPNGTGKTSATALMADALRELGRTVTTTREPGGSPLAEQLRALILDPAVPMDPVQQTMLLNAGRRDHILQVIDPAVDRGEIVLCDRYVASTMVFQTLQKNGMSKAEIVSMHRQTCFDRSPDLMLILDAPVDVLLQRRALRNGEKDRFETTDVGHEERIRNAFLSAGSAFGHDTRTIDTSGSQDQTVARMLDAISHLI